MNSHTMSIVALAILYAMALGTALHWRAKYKRATSTVPNTARLTMRAGATLTLVDDDGGAIAVVILDQVTRDMNGTSASFVDYFNWMARNSR